MKTLRRIDASLTIVSGGLVVSCSLVQSPAGALTSTCKTISKALVIQTGYTDATGPNVTAYNYTNKAANAANAVGTTLDFGPTSVVISCLAPSDLTKTATLLHKPAFTPESYLAYMKATIPGLQSQNIMGIPTLTRTVPGSTAGLGSMTKAAKLRVDAFMVRADYVIIVESIPTLVSPGISLKYLVLGIVRSL